ncbi:capsular polysaccharide synthesis protein [Flexivirga oryzae]|uniref:Capsular biosynthesis protein n=1 Tax=Flexivirga oryzae TaxID=1794944 RepID=A0A839N7R1_9MICO|nr:capsular polysaccharide synthesis protein [Flexivirga oryzae]MBB2893820.1 hypothetical protein [Flexivirga oryzae]
MSRLNLGGRDNIAQADVEEERDQDLVCQALDGPCNGDWSHALEDFSQCVRAGYNSRSIWLHLASAYERAGRPFRARHLTFITNDLFPSEIYQANRAFAAYAKAPAEREQMALFLHANIHQLRERALAAVTKSKSTARRIYMYWDAEPPPLTRMCFEAARKHLPDGYELVILDAESARRAAPEAVRIGAAASLGKAHVADVIRTHLLAEHGGLWMDATVLVNRRFPSFLAEISQEDFFLFRYRGSRTGNWFWWAEPGSYRLQLIRAALDLWLSEGRVWSNYFMFHDIVEMLYWVDDRYRSDWDAGLALHPRAALAIKRELANPITDVLWDDLLTRSPVNKLTWKFRPEALENPRTAVSRLLRGTQ